MNWRTRVLPLDWVIVAIVLIFSTVLFVIALLLKDYNTTSVEAISNADYVRNDGYRLYAQDYEVIIDQRTGMEYLYFPGYGVTPYIDENGDVLKVVE